MTKKILFAVGSGVLLGIFLPSSFEKINSQIIHLGLCALLFFVGIDLGKSNEVFRKIKMLGVRILIVPLAIGAGSILAGILVGLLMGYKWNEGAAVASGFAWYSLAPILIASHSAELSAIALLSNVTREVFSIIFVPWIAKHIGFFEAIAPTGAAGMDTLLPIVSEETDSTTAVICFVSGVILSFAVPGLVTFFIGL